MNKKNADIAERQQRIEKLEKQLADNEARKWLRKKEQNNFVKLKEQMC